MRIGHEEREVEWDVARSLARQATPGRNLALAGIGLVVLALWQVFPHRALVAWAAVALLEWIVTWLLAYRYMQRLIAGEHLDGWRWRLGFGFTTFGLAWGSLTFFALAEDDPTPMWLSVVVVLGVLTGVTTTAAASRMAFVLSTVGLTTPLMLAVLLSNSVPDQLAALSIGYVVIVIGVHHALHGGLIESLESRMTAERLSRQLSEFLAERDPQTHLLNRRSFISELDALLRECDHHVRVEVSNVRRLGAINELYGEPYGDELISHIGQRLATIPAEVGFAGRLGGDAFAIAWRDESAMRPLANVAGGHFAVDGMATRIDFTSATLGAEPDARAEQLVAAALHALDGPRRASPAAHSRPSDTTAARRELVDELRGGLREAGVQPWFQPIVDAETELPVSWEALIRWQHPQLGLITPDRLLPLIEIGGMSAKLVELLVTDSIALMRRLDDAGMPGMTVSVNISAGSLRNPSFADLVLGAAEDDRIAADRLVLELTEREILNIDPTVRDTLRQLELASIKLAVDDFGTGYSSLSHLLDFPADVIKIDRRFVADLASSDNSVSLVRGIVSMARGLRLVTVAEGVEDRGTMLQARDLGCDLIQGFLFSPALPRDEAIEWARTQVTRIESVQVGSSARLT